jgi:hypothetical protein
MTTYHGTIYDFIGGEWMSDQLQPNTTDDTVQSDTAMSDAQLYSKIVKQFRESLGSLSELHAEFREYDDFYLAKQWNEKRASWRPNPIVNYIAYIVDSKAPQITNQRPSGLILPTSSEDEEAAKLFTQITEVISDRVNLDERIDELVRTGLLMGTGFLKVYWDNSLEGGSLAKLNIWKGDVAIDNVDPTSIYPDPQATSIDECRFIIYAVPKSIKWVEEKFGVKVDPESATEGEVYNRMSNNYTKNRCMMYEYWYRENGTINCIYAAGGKILKKIPNIYKHGRYPFVPFIAKKNRKSLWGIGEPKNIINNQKLINKLLEIPTTSALLTSNPIALVNPNSGIDPKKWTNKPGQVWTTRDINNAVKWLQPPSVSGDVYNGLERLITLTEKMSGVYDAATGNTPQGITAATAIQLLQEQASLPVKGITRNLFNTLKEVYEQMMELIKENYTETRYIRITNEQGQHEFLKFKGSEFAEIDFDLKVTGTASTPMSEAFLSQLGNDLLHANLLLPSEYVRMLPNFPGKDKVEQRLMEMEQAPPPPPPSPNGNIPMPAQQQTPMPQPQVQQPDLNMIYQSAPTEIQHQMDLMHEQGMSDEQILNALLQMNQK